MRRSKAYGFLCGCIAALCLSVSPLAAQTDTAPVLKTLYAFPGGGDGLDPDGGLAASGGVFYGTTEAGGAHNLGTIFSINPTSGAEKVLYSFQASDAGGPQSGMLALGGVLYGIGNVGGANGYGGVYSYTIATGVEKVVFSFTPAMGGGSGSNVTISGSTLYGTTFGGGTGAGFGTVFKLDLTTGVETTLYSFTGGADGGSPQYGVTLANGILYGTTVSGGGGGGTLFAVNASTGAEKTLFSFDNGVAGGYPDGGVIVSGDVLYGTAAYGGSKGYGVIFGYDLATAKENTVYNFTGQADGGNPYSTLIDVGGILYGTTFAGASGVSPYGAVFGVNAKTGAETTLYTFPANGSNGGHSYAPLAYSNGVLYGTSFGLETASDQCGTVFRITVATKAEKTLHAFLGASPFQRLNSGLLDVGGTLYGVAAGGADFYGIIYKINPRTDTQSTLYTFTGGADGGAPKGGLVADGALLYGVTEIGGANQAGTIFSFNPSSGAETVLYSFPANAGTPSGPLALLGGVLYGTTAVGGSSGAGSVFAFNPTKNAFATLYSFTGGADGGGPGNGVTAVGSTLFGATDYGGSLYAGTVFKVAIATGKETVLHNFGYDTNGTSPFTPPAYVNGVLYGTTLYGGTQSADCFGGYGCGVLYSIALSTGTFKVLHSFDDLTDGAIPFRVLYSGGTLYAVTNVGGAPGYGTLVSYVPATSSFTTLYSFTGGADGGYPFSPLIASAGVLYGTTNGGSANGHGTVFSFVP
jgi:uncharacterized repeat protein (TIGR03803 family)